MVAERYERQAEESILAQEKHKAELANVNNILANIAVVRAKFATKRERLKVEEIFISNEISRELVEHFIQTIVVDDTNNKIQIVFKTDKE